MANIDDIKSKVSKLLALAEGSTVEQEKANARAAADKLIQQYRLEEADFTLKTGNAPAAMVSKIVASQGRRTEWRETLLSELSTHYGCAWFLTSKRLGGFLGNKNGDLQGRAGSKGFCTYSVVGSANDVDIVEYMYVSLTNSCERLCKWHSNGKGVGFAHAFLSGLAMGISSQFRDLRVAAKVQHSSGPLSAALAVLDGRVAASCKEMERLYPSLGVAARNTGGRDVNAKAEGFTQGRKVQITNGMGSGTSCNPKLATG